MEKKALITFSDDQINKKLEGNKGVILIHRCVVI